MRNVILAGVFLVLSGCQTAQRAEALEESVRSYVLALKRQDNQAAVQFVKPQGRTEFFQGLRTLERYQFSDIRVNYVSPSENLDQALVTMAIEYFSPSGMELYQAERFLSWEYDPEHKRWFLHEQHPLGQTSPQQMTLQ